MLRLAAFAAAVTSSVLLAGCSAPVAQPEQAGFIGPEEYLAEYQAAIADFPEPMPSDIPFPSAPAPLNGTAEASVGEAQAYFLWACAWEDKLLNSEDPAEKELAIEQISHFSSTSWAKVHYQDPDGIWKNMAAKAALGDVSEVRSSFDGDCIYYQEARDGG